MIVISCGLAATVADAESDAFAEFDASFVVHAARTTMSGSNDRELKRDIFNLEFDCWVSG
jgi:hypothetical protein